jgi:hypothetical protein
MAETIRAGAGDRLATFRERLAVEPERELADERLGARFAAAVYETARRVGLVAAADLRAVARLLGRLDENGAKLPAVGQPEAIEEYLDGSPEIRALLSFAATRQYGQIVA